MILAPLLLTAILTADSTPPDPCASWTMNSYTIGMTKAAALAVRPAKKGILQPTRIPEGGSFFRGQHRRVVSV